MKKPNALRKTLLSLLLCLSLLVGILAVPVAAAGEAVEQGGTGTGSFGTSYTDKAWYSLSYGVDSTDRLYMNFFLKPALKDLMDLRPADITTLIDRMTQTISEMFIHELEKTLGDFDFDSEADLETAMQKFLDEFLADGIDSFSKVNVEVALPAIVEKGYLTLEELQALDWDRVFQRVQDEIVVLYGSKVDDAEGRLNDLIATVNDYRNKIETYKPVLNGYRVDIDTYAAQLNGVAAGTSDALIPGVYTPASIPSYGTAGTDYENLIARLRALVDGLDSLMADADYVLEEAEYVFDFAAALFADASDVLTLGAQKVEELRLAHEAAPANEVLEAQYLAVKNAYDQKNGEYIVKFSEYENQTDSYELAMNTFADADTEALSARSQLLNYIDELENGITECRRRVEAKLAEMEAGTEQTPTIGSLEELFSALMSVTVNGHVLYSDAGISLEALKALVAELDLPSLLDKADGERFVTCSVTIETTLFKSITFDLKAGLEGDIGPIKTALSMVKSMLSVSKSGDVLNVTLNVPEKVCSYLNTALNLEQLPAAVKNKFFTWQAQDGTDLKALLQDLTFAEVKSLLANINFEKILDSDFVKQYVDLTHLTNEQINEKIASFESYFNKAISTALEILKAIEADPKTAPYMNITLFEIYQGGGVFQKELELTITAATVNELLGRFVPQYASFISSMLNLTDTTLKVNGTVNFASVRKVTYKVGEQVVQEGFLPYGAQIGKFALKEHGGYPILGWYDYVRGVPKEVTTLAVNSDITVYAKLGYNLSVTPGEAIREEWTYNGTGYTVTVLPGYPNDNPDVEYTYQWYVMRGNREGKLIGQTSNQMTFTNVDDSGTYKCKVYVNDGGFKYEGESAYVTIEIHPAAIPVEDFAFSENSFVYNAAEHTMSMVVPEAYQGIVSVFLAGHTGTAVADAYHAVATLTLLDKNNYVFTQNSASIGTKDATVETDWAITPVSVAADDLHWDYNNFFAYDGTEKSVAIVLPAALEALVQAGELTVAYSGTTAATDHGMYNAAANLVVTAGKEGNFLFPDGNSWPLAWSIGNKEKLELTEVGWDYTAPFVYNGQEKTVSLHFAGTGLPSSFAVDYYEGVRAATNANTGTDGYTVKARFTGYDETTHVLYLNGQPAQTEWELEWFIAPMEIDFSQFVWINSDVAQVIRYDGQEKNVSLYVPSHLQLLMQNGDFHIVYSGTTAATDVGDYNANAELVLDDGVVSNYRVIGTTTSNYDWSIEKARLVFDSASWNYNAPFVYSGNAQEVLLQLVGPSVVLNYTGTQSATDAGHYSVSASIEGVDDNYEIIVDGLFHENLWELDWAIDPLRVDISALTWNQPNGVQFLYDGTEVVLELLGALPAGVRPIQYTSNKATVPGTYTAEALLSAESDNYLLVRGTEEKSAFTLTSKFIINKLTVNMGGVTLEDGELVYDGQEHNLTLGGTLPDGIVAHYSAPVKNAGTHTVTVTFENTRPDAAYTEPIPSMTATLVITPILVDLSAITFKGATIDYDGQGHSLAIGGVLPAGVSVSYDKTNLVEAGMHKIVATFTHADPLNYKLSVTSKTATLTIRRSSFVSADNETTVDIISGGGNTSTLGTTHVTDNYTDLDLSAILPAGKNGYVGKATDIVFTNDKGEILGVQGEYNVKMLIPEALRDKNLMVIHIADDGTIEVMESTREGDYMCFTTTHFSIYAIVVVEEPAVPDAPVSIPWQTIAIIAAAVVVLVLLILLLILVIKKKPVKPAKAPKAIAAKEPAPVAPAAHEPTEIVTVAPPTEEPVSEAPAEVEEPVIAAVVEEPDAVTDVVEEPAPIIRATNYRKPVAAADPVEEKAPAAPVAPAAPAAPAKTPVAPAVKKPATAVAPVKPLVVPNITEATVAPAKESTEKKEELKQGILTFKYDGMIVSYESREIQWLDVEEDDGEDETPVANTPLISPFEPDTAPAAEASEPAAEAPVVEEPVAEAPAAEAPVVEEPAVEEPVVEAPAEEEPVTEAPVAEAPAVEEPVVEEPVVEEPVVEEPVVEEPVVEAPAVEEPVVEASVAEVPAVTESAVAVPALYAEEESDKEFDNGDETLGHRVIDGRVMLVRYRSSFLSRLAQTTDFVKEAYNTVKNEIHSFRGVTSVLGWNAETILKGSRELLKINVKDDMLVLYFALDPSAFNANKYHFVNVGSNPKLSAVPVKLRIRSERSLKYALELLAALVAAEKLKKDSAAEVKDYRLPYEDTEDLVERGWVKPSYEPFNGNR